MSEPRRIFVESTTTEGAGIITAAPQKRDANMHFAIYVALASLLIGLISLNFVDIDIWHQMALIRESLRAGHLLKADVFAYTPTLVPSVHHEWGAGVIAYFASKWFGGAGIIALKFLAALATLFVCIRTAEKAGADTRTIAFLAPIGIYLMHAGFLSTIRAQAYTFLFLATLLYLLGEDSRDRRSWILPWLAVFPLWLNVHGGFVVGIGVVLMHAAEQVLDRKPWRHLLFIAAAMCCEVLINPFGGAYVRYLGRALTMSRPQISEWRSIWGLSPLWSTLFVAALALAAVAWAARKERRKTGVIVLLATAVEGMLHRKLMPLFAIAWLCYVPSYVQSTRFASWIMRFAERRRKFVLACCLAMVATSLVSAVRMRFWEARVPQGPPQISYPVGAVEYLQAQNFHGRLMTPYAFGAYVSWKMYPAVRVSIDGRYEVAYEEALLRDMNNFYDAKGDWRATLTKYPTDLVLVPTESAVSEKMPSSRWTQVYADGTYKLFARPGVILNDVTCEGESFAGSIP